MFYKIYRNISKHFGILKWKF